MIDRTFVTLYFALYGLKTIFQQNMARDEFTAKDVKLKMEKELDNQDKLHLNRNGMNILDWFREDVSGR